MISEEMGLTQLQTKDIVQRTLDEITRTLVSEGRIELRNFGVFEIRRHAPRKARNPRTGEKVDIPAKNVVTFKPGKEMEQQVRKLDLEGRRNTAEDSGNSSPSSNEAEAETFPRLA
jgi:nucleoid DNA-binding protein